MSDKGFKKNDLGKDRMTLVPPEAVRGVAKVMTFGERKYAANNWRQPTEWSRFLDAAKRHLNDFECGVNWDVGEGGSGLHVIDHAIAELMMLSASIKNGVGTDDRPRVPNTIEWALTCSMVSLAPECDEE